jgi:predicted transposase YdaD
MTLTKDLEREFQQELKQYEEERKMPYITSIERTGEKRGELKGELKGKQKLVIKLLNQRFGEIEQSLIQKIRKLPGRQLEELTDVWLTLANVTELERWLQNRLKPVEK